MEHALGEGAAAAAALPVDALVAAPAALATVVADGDGGGGMVVVVEHGGGGDNSVISVDGGCGGVGAGAQPGALFAPANNHVINERVKDVSRRPAAGDGGLSVSRGSIAASSACMHILCVPIFQQLFLEI